jgi:F-type H+-transporting ATPase subunit delta
VTKRPRTVLHLQDLHARRRAPADGPALCIGRASLCGPGTWNRALPSAGTTISSGGGLADRYAAALYAHAGDEHALDEVIDQMEALGRLVDESPDLRRLLASPLIGVNTAQRATRAVLAAQGFGRIVQDFVGVIVSNRRLGTLRRIINAFAALVAEKRGLIVAEVETAYPLSDIQEQQLRARLIESGYSNVNIIKRVDPSLLGGLVVKIGARLYDSSLKSRLQRLQYAMKGAA